VKGYLAQVSAQFSKIDRDWSENFIHQARCLSKGGEAEQPHPGSLEYFERSENSEHSEQSELSKHREQSELCEHKWSLRSLKSDPASA